MSPFHAYPLAMEWNRYQDCVQVPLSAVEHYEVVSALIANCERHEKNRQVAIKAGLTRLAEQYTVWLYMSRAALDRFRLAMQNAEDAAGLAPELRATPASGDARVTPELAEATRGSAITLLCEYLARYGDTKRAPEPDMERLRATNKRIESLEPEGRC